jgi:hypothetical protein
MRRAGQHRPSSRVDGAIASRRPDLVVEEQANVFRRRRQDRAVCRLRADEASMSRGGRRKDEREQREKGDASQELYDA